MRSLAVSALFLAACSVHAYTYYETFSDPYTGFPSTQLYNHSGSGPDASIIEEDDGSFLRLAYADVQDTLNNIEFNFLEYGELLSNITIRFDFRMGGATENEADGMGVALLSDDWSGSSIEEEIYIPDSLGIGFDVFDNGEVDNFSSNHLSFHWNGEKLDQIEIPWDLADNEWHEVIFYVDFTGNYVSVDLDGVNYLNYDMSVVDDFDPYSFDLVFGARTGLFTNNHDLDDVGVTLTPIPEPATIAMLFGLVAACLALLRRRVR